MTAKLDYIAIRNEFMAEWDDLTPVAEENLSFEPPSNKIPYIYFAVTSTESQAISIGVHSTRNRAGVVMITAYCPENSGPGDMLDIEDRIHSIFQSNGVITNVVFGPISVQNVGRYKKGYWCKTYLINFDSYKFYNP